MSEITLPDALRAELEAHARAHDIAPGDLVCSAVEEYIYFRRLREFRARMVEEARNQGLLTEEDVFARLA